MKHFIIDRLYALLAVTMMSMGALAAETFVQDGVTYQITDSKGAVVAVIAGSSKYAGSVVIPATVTNGEVTRYRSMASTANCSAP